MKIIWKDIKGFNGRFKINSNLEVYRVDNFNKYIRKELTSDNCYAFSLKGVKRRKYRPNILFLEYFPDEYILRKIKDLEVSIGGTWKQLKDWEYIYLINNNGLLYKLDFDGFANGSVKDNGYIKVSLCRKGNKAVHSHVHRLVANTFIPNPENKPEVNHIDGDKTNNSVSNLEWVTRSENGIHKYKVLDCDIAGQIEVVVYDTIKGIKNRYKSIAAAERAIIGKNTTILYSYLDTDKLYKNRYKIIRCK